QAVRGLSKRLGLQPVLLGRFPDVEGVAAITRDAAFAPQHIERHVAAVIFKDNAQRGRPTLDGLLLEDCRGPDRPELSLSRAGHARPPRPIDPRLPGSETRSRPLHANPLAR